MKIKFKTRTNLSKAKTRRVRERSIRIALGIPLLRLLINAKTEEEFQTLLAQYNKEVEELHEIIESFHWEKLPRKLKKKEKLRISDIYNAFVILPELAIFISYNRNEKDPNKAQYFLYRTWAYFSKRG